MRASWLCAGLLSVVAGGLFALSAAGFAGPAVEVKILLPLGRAAYQTNEWIDVSILRSGSAALPAGALKLDLAGADGSKIDAAFAVTAAPVEGNTARSTEHLHLNGRLLRPGHYSLTASVNGGTATTELDVYTHLRESSFRLVNWGRAQKKESQLVQGEDSLGFNLFYGGYNSDEDANLLRAGVDFMANCVMSGGHQMDLRMECDWSDPYVTRGGTLRVVRRAMIDRTRPNVPGVHFYDEPGLTWGKNPETGEFTPHGIPSQLQAYVNSFETPPPSYQKVDPKKPEDVARWRQWARWKLGFMDAAWKEAQFGVSRVRSDFLSVTQSQYGWSAFTDGYYFNVVRSLPVTSGHGGYDDYGPAYFNPSMFEEMARARDHGKPCWYLPTWYGNTAADQFRAEQYLSFQTNIQGMISPPDLEPATNPVGRQGIVESNQLMKRLGPIFTTMAVTKPPVAMLYSLSQAIHAQTEDRSVNYVHGMPQGKNLPYTYLAGKLLQQQFLPVLDEDVLDGTLAADHKAVILTSIDFLDPGVARALESYIQSGGLVLMTGDSTVAIKGAVKLPVAARMPDQQKIDELAKEKKWSEMAPYQTAGKFFEASLPLARAIKVELDRIGVQPVFESDVPTIAATRQAARDVEYLFAVNATYDETDKKNFRNALKATGAAIKLPADGKALYDAIVGGPAPFTAAGDKREAHLRFGPGQMRAFARTARPIGGIRLATPVLYRNLANDDDPLGVTVGLSTVDDAGRLLSGSIPLHVRVVDPLGVTRHELFRATELGTFTVRLPLAANDPPGAWKVIARELLNNGEETATFTFAPPPRAGALAGMTRRAVYAVNDLDNVFRFARTFREVTIVKGTSAHNDAAAQRIVRTLEPWGVHCKELPLAEAAKSRKISDAEARTWIGLNYAGSGAIKPGDANAPALAGFAVQGPVILLGNAEDNPIIKFLLTEKFLPYKPEAGVFPGVGRGHVTWQLGGVGRGQESISLIAHDEAGMSEAVGTFYEAAVGMQPLTRWRLPRENSLAPAKSAPGHYPALQVAWTAVLPDRVDALGVEGGLVALSHDGTRATLGDGGKVTASAVLEPAALEGERKKLAAPPATPAQAAKLGRPDRMTKLVAAHGGLVAVAFWGGTLRVGAEGGEVHAEQQLPQDITALAWQGDNLVVGLADGRVLALKAK